MLDEVERLRSEIRKIHDVPFWDDVDDEWICIGCEWTTRIVDVEFAQQAHDAHVDAILNGGAP